jgi:hypothetical protein
MSSILAPAELPLAMEEACKIAVECWRLGRIAELLKDSDQAVGLRHATRRIREALSAVDIEILDFAGRIYDPGLVPEVAEVRDDEGVPGGQSIIEETVSPTLTWRGTIIKVGQIIVKRSPSRSVEHPGVER